LHNEIERKFDRRLSKEEKGGGRGARHEDNRDLIRKKEENLM
jgi:hypothetical protein